MMKTRLKGPDNDVGSAKLDLAAKQEDLSDVSTCSGNSCSYALDGEIADEIQSLDVGDCVDKSEGFEEEEPRSPRRQQMASRLKQTPPEHRSEPTVWPAVVTHGRQRRRVTFDDACIEVVIVTPEEDAEVDGGEEADNQDVPEEIRPVTKFSHKRERSMRAHFPAAAAAQLAAEVAMS
eukprot:TRINITY_DN12738_c0_g1_i2.p1 TRINITY_DN12738_c0_g1~~TRINITY_DN12738_c0_g1_i2.p1  ORF type:complete len:178 (-),score=42.09 TRINITY_DN12738_c0_g1_i2:392-925(-)